MDESFMQEAIDLAVESVQSGGGPFGAVIIRGGEVLARGMNRVTCANDPTAHAEVVAIRRACEALGAFDLKECTLYASCEPCPMCLGAIYWAHLDRIFYAGTKADAAAAGFDDAHIYAEIARPPARRRIPMQAVLRSQAQRPFEVWAQAGNRIEY